MAGWAGIKWDYGAVFEGWSGARAGWIDKYVGFWGVDIFGALFLRGGEAWSAYQRGARWCECGGRALKNVRKIAMRRGEIEF